MSALFEIAYIYRFQIYIFISHIERRELQSSFSLSYRINGFKLILYFLFKIACKNQDACPKTMVHIPYNHKGLYFSVKSLAPKGLDAKDWHF
jgi:hypothetical protein